MEGLDRIGRDLPVLVAGPTASGKSALAMAIAERLGGVIVNADALQVYGNWRVLTARPDAGDEARVPHRLYGHVAPDAEWSVGHWLRAVAPLLAGPDRPIIVGGTGLYLSALTGGLAEVPPVPPDVRAEADARMAAGGIAALLAEIDPATAARIDRQNPARVQRAWEVLRATGRGLADWQAETAAPLLPAGQAHRLRVEVPPAVLAERIARRFDAMLAAGALDEVRANLPGWDPRRPASRAIGAADLVAHLRGEVPLDVARARAIVSTRQYAKRQRTWFRARMADWDPLCTLGGSSGLHSPAGGR
jgi:tRNA dimethylallyltransferase